MGVWLDPRWYQDFSPNQIKNLTNLENAMRVDQETRITTGTQQMLADIGVTSTFFKLRPNIIKELRRSCNFDSVHFLREVYRILTGNDFQEEEYKKFYNCNERIILSAIAFLTLPETIKELHRRLPVIVPKFPPKPKLIRLTRRKSSCPYKEELFKRQDWAGYRNDLQKWWKQYKLHAVPKVFLPFEEYTQSYIADKKIESEIYKKREEDIYSEYLEETNVKQLQDISVNKLDQKDEMNVEQQIKCIDKVFSSVENLEAEKSKTFDIPRLPDESKKFDFTIMGLSEKPGVVEYKICGTLKPPGAGRKSWLSEKDAHYIIAGASEDPPNCPVTYEISGVANVTPSNSDERFFAVLKLGDGPRKIFPSGRENLSRNWQEWLRNADEEFRQAEKRTNELIESVRATTRLMFPGPFCDDCCSCRQTRKTREKQLRTKTPYLMIDNVLQDGDEIKYIVGSMAMHSPAPSPTGSVVNLLEMIASQDEIKTNIIINGVTDENGKMQYYISGIQKEKTHVPSRVSDLPVSEPVVRNVPPCACAIQQMFNKQMSPSASKDDIPWTKDEGLCYGKKYRPKEPAAYSCKMYPGDKSCRRNPFMKEIVKMKKRKMEDEKEDGKEERVPVEMVKEQTQVSRKRIEKKKGRFIPDPDYPAYDYPWNISRTAPSAKILETDYEKTLKLTSPELPAITSPSRTQEESKDDSSPTQESKKPKTDIANKRMDEKVSHKIFPSLPRKKEEKEKRSKEKEDTRKKNVRIPYKKIHTDKKGIKPMSKILKSVTTNKMKKYEAKSPLVDKSVRQRQNNKFSYTDYGRSRRLPIKKPVCECKTPESTKKDKKKSTMDEVDKHENRKQEMARLKTMLKSAVEGLGDIQPAILPWEQSATFRSESKEKSEEIDNSLGLIDEDESLGIAAKGPCGWRTKSEQELPAKKTLAYLCEPDYPLETIVVRPGGRPCRCRENRNKKKILMYSMGGLVDKKDRKGTRKKNEKTSLEEENRIIEGVVWFTPPVSPRRSDEYVPEYDLLESPYDTCVGKAADKRLKLIERYSGPKSLIEKIQKRLKPCNCSDYTGIAKKDNSIDQKKNIEEARRKWMESASPEERWTMALKDPGLMDYFTQRKDNTPCWTSCAKYSRVARPRRLTIKKPVCECKYERKIVERNEERAQWKARQRKLKTLKKQPFMHIVDTSRPMVPDTRLIISGVKRIPREDEYADDIKYCITGVAENLTMSAPQQIVDGLKMSTPCVTPEPSKEDISPVTPHRHWSPMNIPPGPLPRKGAALKEEMERRKKIRDEALKLIYGDEIEQDAHCLVHRCQGACDREKCMKREEKSHETSKNNRYAEKKVSDTLTRLHSPSPKKTKIRYERKVSSNKVVNKVTHEGIKHLEEAAKRIDHQQHAHKQISKRTEEKKKDEDHRMNSDNDRQYPVGKLDLTAIMKAELKKMAAEGYVFAELPKCYLMPQLRDWIMHREDVVFSEIDKKKLMLATISHWQRMEVPRMPKVPSLHMTEHQLKKLTYDQAKEMKEKVYNQQHL